MYGIITITKYHSITVSCIQIYIEREYVYLETIEYHRKYSNPEVHKLEILKKLSLKEKKEKN
jgi:hypothetical protein